MMRIERLRGQGLNLVKIAPTYGFMFFFGPVAWQLWMALRLGFVSLEESRRWLLSPCTVFIAASLFILNSASLTQAMERTGAGKDRAASRGMAVHCVSLLAFATVGTAASMSTLAGAHGGGACPPLRIVVGSLNGASMCFVFYAASTAGVIARLVQPGRPASESTRRLVAMTRAFNVWLYAMGLPLFVVTSLAAASMGGGAPADRPTPWLLASMAVPVTMGSLLFIRADKAIASLRGTVRKESVR